MMQIFFIRSWTAGAIGQLLNFPDYKTEWSGVRKIVSIFLNGGERELCDS